MIDRILHEIASSELLLIAVVAGVALLALALSRGLVPGELSRLNVRPKPLMTPPERRVCAFIERALPGARVHAQVSMGALMNPAKGLSKSEWWTTFNKFSSKRVDFAVEDPSSGEIILLIELDDRSHKAGKDRDRDSLTRQAGYTTLRLPAGERHSAQSVAQRISRALNPNPESIAPTTQTKRQT